MDKQNISVVLADDHPLLMAGFSFSLADSGIQVLAQCRSADEAVQKYIEHRPDVIILDIRFGGEKSGFDAAREILTFDSQARIIFLSQFDQESMIQEAYGLGAKAFITKATDPSMLEDAIRKIFRGGLYFLPEVAEKLAHLSIGGGDSPKAKLDAREMDIFVDTAMGLTQAEIAAKRALSAKTVGNVMQQIKEKLGISRPADITRLAVKHGYIDA